MEPASDLYEEVALAYIRLVRLESEDAAAAIEQIHTEFGSHAALRAALIIRLVKVEVQQNHWIPKIGVYTHLLEDYPGALPLAKHAMDCCLQSWSVAEPEIELWIERTLAGWDMRSTS